MHAVRALVACTLVVSLALSGCAPARTNSTYSAGEIGRTAELSYGVIISMRAVEVQGGNTGVGTLGGAAVGGVAGSFIGGRDVRGNILGAVAGAVIGGIAGTVAEGAANSGTAVEFVIQEDNGRTITVVQTNEDNFRPGDRVALSRGARTRLARVLQ